MVLRRVGMPQPEEVHGGQLVFEVVNETLGHCAVACEIRAYIERFGLREFPARTEASGSVKDMSAVRRILNISGAGRGILSVFHDENENWQMDMLEGKGPAEGYVLKSCEVKDEEATFKLKLYYPVNQ